MNVSFSERVILNDNNTESLLSVYYGGGCGCVWIFWIVIIGGSGGDAMGIYWVKVGEVLSIV